jgi:S1-C subfamily serine protease
LRAAEPLKVRPMTIGKAADIKERDPVLAASFGGRGGVAPAYVISKREFAAGWEYLLDQAFFTAPAHTDWAGAALISREGKLIGVGSLVVADATGKGDGLAGNMYVPIDILQPILGDLLAQGHAAGPPRPPKLAASTGSRSLMSAALPIVIGRTLSGSAARNSPKPVL